MLLGGGLMSFEETFIKDLAKVEQMSTQRSRVYWLCCKAGL